MGILKKGKYSANYFTFLPKEMTNKNAVSSGFCILEPVRDIKKTKPRIHQFTNLKCFKMSFKVFEMKKQGLKCF